MEPFLTDRQRRFLILAALVSVLLIDAHALRTFLEAQQFLEAQRKSQLSLLISILKREIEIEKDVLATPDTPQRAQSIQPLLFRLSTRYGLLSAEILTTEGVLVAASQSGRPLMVPDGFPGLAADKRRQLVQKGEAQSAAPASATDSAVQTVSVYIPFGTTGSRFILKAALLDENIVRVGQISRDIVLYQFLGVGVTVLFLVLIGLWVLRPYRRVLKAARTARAEVLPDQEAPRDDNLMMISSFQGVIARLREKEKELLELSRVDRERAETAARMSTDMLQQMDSAVLLFSSQGRVLQSNRAASDHFGFPPLVLYNQHYGKLFERESEWQMLIEAAMQKSVKEQERLLPLLRRGAEQLYRVSVTPVAEPDGRHGAICIFTDVTERTRLEQLLAEKEKLAALGEMAGGLAHEVRNSLGTMVGLMRLLSPPASAPRGDESEKYQGMMQKEVHELNRLVTEFLDFTRPITARLDPTDIVPILERCRGDLDLQAPRCSERLQIPTEAALVRGDEALLRQAFMNLLRNALESGGEVRVAVEADVNREKGELHLRFRDDGPGIAAPDIEKVFIPFYTTKESGYGIGLALVKKTVLAHSGRVDVESAPGQGTTFHVFLPIATDRSEAEAPGGEPKTAP